MPTPLSFAGRLVRTVFVVSLGVLLAACEGERGAGAYDAAAVSAVMDSLLASQYGAGEPGAALVLRRGDAVLYEGAVGVADLETGRPLTPETPLYIASLAKPITAAAVATLVAREQLRLADTLGALIPELESYSAVRVDQLLSHTSGIPDYFTYVSFRDLRVLDNQAVIDTLEAHGPDAPPAAPGYAYSNSNYVLLADIVSRATGQPFPEVLAALFFEPLGLTSAFVDAGSEPYPAAARAYMPRDDGFRISEYEFVELPGGIVGQFDFRTTGAGGLYMSAADLARWMASRRLLPATQRGGMQTPSALIAVDSLTTAQGLGSVRGYAEGWFYSEVQGHTVAWHDGNRGGFNASMAVVPHLDLALVVLANRGDRPTTPLVETALTRLLDPAAAR